MSGLTGIDKWSSDSDFMLIPFGKLRSLIAVKNYRITIKIYSLHNFFLHTLR